MTPERQVLPTGTDDLEAELEAGVLLLRLNRPRARNAITLAMGDALAAQLAWAESEPAVRVIVLTGAGAGFCAGGDVKIMVTGRSIYDTGEGPEARIQRQIDTQRGTTVALWESSKPTIALLNGPAVGAGLALALACDVRYAAASATLGSGFAAIGLAGDFGCTWLLNRLLGPSRAKEFLMFSQTVDAGRAAELGLVNEVVADDRLLDEGLTRARRLADAPQTALMMIKAAVARAQEQDLAACSDAEVRVHVRLLATDEHRAAVERLRARISSAQSPA